MKHYVLGLVFNRDMNKVLLVEKLRPSWQKGHWNGIGGKIEEKDEGPLDAMHREALEEANIGGVFLHKITFVCPGGTVYVFAAFTETDNIEFDQREDERLMVWLINGLPDKVMANLRWIIPVCLANLRFPILVHQTTLGVE